MIDKADIKLINKIKKNMQLLAETILAQNNMSSFTEIKLPKNIEIKTVTITLNKNWYMIKNIFFYGFVVNFRKVINKRLYKE